jgi:hypothetical protein
MLSCFIFSSPVNTKYVLAAALNTETIRLFSIAPNIPAETLETMNNEIKKTMLILKSRNAGKLENIRILNKNLCPQIAQIFIDLWKIQKLIF